MHEIVCLTWQAARLSAVPAPHLFKNYCYFPSAVAASRDNILLFTLEHSTTGQAHCTRFFDRQNFPRGIELTQTIGKWPLVCKSFFIYPDPGMTWSGYHDYRHRKITMPEILTAYCMVSSP